MIVTRSALKTYCYQIQNLLALADCTLTVGLTWLHAHRVPPNRGPTINRSNPTPLVSINERLCERVAGMVQVMSVL